MKKRILVFLTIIMSLFLLVACNNNSEDPNDNNGDNGDIDNGDQISEFEEALLRFEDNNYEVTIDILGYGELITTNKMSFDGNLSQYEDENYTEIYERKDNIVTIYTKVAEEWVKSQEDNPIKQELGFYKDFTENMFSANNGTYTLINEDDEIILDFIGELDLDLEINTVELENFKLVIENDFFETIELKLNINSYVYTIKLTFANFGNIELNVPK